MYAIYYRNETLNELAIYFFFVILKVYDEPEIHNKRSLCRETREYD